MTLTAETTEDETERIEEEEEERARRREECLTSINDVCVCEKKEF
jgi:hypothetical protein